MCSLRSGSSAKSSKTRSPTTTSRRSCRASRRKATALDRRRLNSLKGKAAGSLRRRSLTSQPGRGAQPAGNAPGTAFGGVTGVASKSKEKSIRLYKGRNHYNEWQFVYTPPAQAPGYRRPDAPRRRGQRGRGNQSPANPQGGTPFPPGMRGGPGDGRGRGFASPPDGRFEPFRRSVLQSQRTAARDGPSPPGR